MLHAITTGKMQGEILAEKVWSGAVRRAPFVTETRKLKRESCGNGSEKNLRTGFLGNFVCLEKKVFLEGKNGRAGLV